jgi:hypothetical protein
MEGARRLRRRVDPGLVDGAALRLDDVPDDGGVSRAGDRGGELGGRSRGDGRFVRLDLDLDRNASRRGDVWSGFLLRARGERGNDEEGDAQLRRREHHRQTHFR